MYLLALGVPVTLLVLIRAWFMLSIRIGADPRGERLARIRASPNIKDGAFCNLSETTVNIPAAKMPGLFWNMIRRGKERRPQTALPTVDLDREAWKSLPDSAFAVAWFGHSSLLIKMGGITFLVDPVFGPRASMVPFAGPKRFNYRRHINVEQLPPVDVVLLSHDHYDHLDHGTILWLKDKRYVAPLGVGAHLERWGVPPSAITEKDWWESMTVGAVKLTFTPSRHFSGRGMNNRFSTLWGSWVLECSGRKIYFGADSGYSPTFKEVGDRFGPFDLVLLECGAYNALWPLIHMFPEQVAQAAVDLRARVLMPIHWAKFSLALHPWKEPVERLTLKAKELGVPLLTPAIGDMVINADTARSKTWWSGLD
jgi:L-ascorbate metabolism protein UlaG (beta-lactamase superfamily)